VTIRVELEAEKLNEAIVRLIKKKGAAASLVVRRVATAVVVDWQRGMRVDTGRARAGCSAWLIREGVTPIEGPSGAAVVQGRSEGSFEDGTRQGGDAPFVVVTNGVVYVPKLEEMDGALSTAISRSADHIARESSR